MKGVQQGESVNNFIIQVLKEWQWGGGRGANVESC